MGDYADATGDSQPSPRECDTAAAGVWSSRDWAEEEDLGGDDARRRALGLEGEVNAGSASAPYSATLRRPRELHAAPHPRLPQTIVRSARLPRRTKLMVRSAPPTQKRPAGSCSVSGLFSGTNYRMFGLHPQTLLRVGGVVFSSDLALRPRLGQSLRPWTCP
ncbi:LOW QUALITY PROTEIN: uncharacterized protein C19orf73 homolog [Hipposideros larvatus]